MITKSTKDSAALLPDLQRLVRDLKADLSDRLREHPEIDADLRAKAYEPVERGGRTAQAYEVWRDDYLEQVAVAWVLACVFIRYMEDNDLIAGTYLAGITPDRRRQADDAHAAYFQANPRDSDREYLLDVFRRVGSIPAAKDLFAEGKTPLWAVGPSGDGAARLLASWRAIDSESGALLRSFRSEGGGTRFLGDLYQDLSEAARKKYALLQTPDFVEEFILDHTLTPALEEFGLEAVRLIDPTCGSGHFLLGAFRRLFRLWNDREPGTDPTVLAQRALDAVAGVDLNPFAVAIARFRLVVEAMALCGVRRLERAPGWNVHTAHGDSLYHGVRFDSQGNIVAEETLNDLLGEPAPVYAIEDLGPLRRILGRQYHVVVGNPPYIVVRDSVINQAYRDRWSTCHRQYSLGVPFTQRFFGLALAGGKGRSAGFVGMITANSFMKREFGKKLIQEYLPNVDLTYVIDTSGAYIPGHGTPTVILFGRNRRPSTSKVRAVLGIRGEPTTPDDPAKGLVWRSIVDHLDNGQSHNEFVSVTNADRATFEKHPWSIGGGGAAELKERIEEAGNTRLAERVVSIGFYQDTHADEAFVQPLDFVRRHGLQDGFREQVRGENVRDWGAVSDEAILFPFNSKLEQLAEMPREPRWSWFHNLRTLLWSRSTFGGGTYRSSGRPWFDFHQFPKDRARSPLSITFGFVATHNHFVHDRTGKVFNRSAPVIKLTAEESEDDHLSLLGLLNSSSACFWMKQVFFPKGGSGIGRGITDESWEMRYEHDGTKLEALPVLSPRKETLALARELDALARRIVELSPSEMVKGEIPTVGRLSANRAETERLQARMVALQEELDWLCYRLYGLAGEEDRSLEWPMAVGEPPGLNLGERAFEIAMARQMAAGELQTSWFARHGSNPITELPAHWPDAYRVLVQQRLDAIRDDPNIALIERPEYKRRWLREPWDDQVRRALRSWLLDRLESGRYWPDPAHAPPELTSTAALAEQAQHDPEFLQVAALYAGRPDFPLPRLVAELVAAESVPFLPVLRYKPSGLVKRQVWERTWDLQRREDAGEDVGPIPVPPKYASADFLTTDVWRLRGKLDVPKERFVGYPHGSREGDPSLVVGWAGWDHLRQAQALTAYYERMKSREGWPAERLVPLLAGLDQLVPWLLQWHNDLDPEYDLRMGDYYRDFVRDEAQALGYTLDQVQAWEPATKPRKGRRTREGNERG